MAEASQAIGGEPLVGVPDCQIEDDRPDESECQLAAGADPYTCRCPSCQAWIQETINDRKRKAE